MFVISFSFFLTVLITRARNPSANTSMNDVYYFALYYLNNSCITDDTANTIVKLN